MKLAKLFPSSVFAAVLLLVSCVTVNVNFPEGAVQRAADDYVSELYKAKEESKKEETKPPAPVKNKSSLLPLIQLVPEAHAEAPTFTTDTPKAKEIQDRQKSRIAAIDDYKAKGVIGEGADGVLALKESAALKPIEKKRVEKLIEDENSDRSALYSEIARANNISDSAAGTIKKTFSEAFLKASPAGTHYMENGAWKKK